MRQKRQELETMVEERTTKLSESNRLLSEEIDERRRVEEALKQSERRYRKISELTSDIAYAFRVNHNAGLSLEWISGPVKRITGFTLEELRTLGGWNSIVHPDDMPIIEDQLKAVFEGQSKKVQYRIKSPKGHICWLLDNKQPGYNQKQGRVDYIYGAVQDITEEKRAQNDLENSEQKYRELLENANEGIAVAQDGLMKFVNPQMVELLGYQEQELTSRPFLDFVHPDDQTKVLEYHSKKLKNIKMSERYKIKVVDKNGGIKWIENNGVGIKWEGRPATLNFLTDITEKRLIERHLIQKEKLSSLGILVSSIAHEINNPNNFVSFNIPVLRDYINEMIPIIEEYVSRCMDFEICNMAFPEFREDIFKLLDNMKNGYERISAFVSNLRQFSQYRQMNSLIWVELNDVVDRVLSICHSKIKKSVKSFEKTIPENLPEIHTEPYALEQILLNLIINATQAVDKKNSWIKLIVSVVDGTHNQISIEVIDNGCGMDEQTQLKIYDPFFTTKQTESGTGLGLYVCHMMAERLGGRIELESEPGNGSNFKLILPVEKIN